MVAAENKTDAGARGALTMTTTDDEKNDGLAAVLSTRMKQQCAVVDFTPKETTAISQIYNLQELSLQLPDICNSIYKTLGSQQCEATYQRCLALELQQAGLCSVEQEVEIPLVYKGRIVGTRRADLVVSTASKERAVLELKAVRTLSPSHARQLQYYMHHFNIENGYLINFPHDDGFPSVEHKSVFRLTALTDNNMKDTLDAPTLQLRHDPNKAENPQQVQLIQFQRLELDTKEGQEILGKKSRAASPKWGVTSTGLSCKFCQEEQGYCRYHKDQDTETTTTTSQSSNTHGCRVS